MSFNKILITSVTCLLLVVFSACNAHDTDQIENTDITLSVVVSIVPQAYFVKKIAGASAAVEILAPPNHTAETHQLTPRQMDTLSHADVYFRIGMPFETPLVKRLHTLCPRLKVVDTREGIDLINSSCTHDHIPGSHHDGSDPHIWLDPMRVKIQVRTIAASLSTLAPEHTEKFTENLNAFEIELNTLHKNLKNILAEARGRVLYVYHPAFGYLADTYGFEQRSIEFEGKSPGSKHLYTLIDEIKEAHIKTIFVQPQYASGPVSVIAKATGVTVLPLNSLMDDYSAGMEELAHTIAASFK
ncbi:MAG: zinc ABC transporter substrate-binding protein [Candidatus Hydrogenedentes bacterium]|nr:zinc ABC transporter substrate-binding protein [Candidatus Hydrogenedentota bacterium]